MKHLELYEARKVVIPTPPQLSVKEFCKKYHIKNYKINEDGSIDVDGEVDLIGQLYINGLKQIPIKFNRIYGGFYCGNNNLITLENCPIHVDEEFSCLDNNLRTLEYCPTYVGEMFDCGFNKLTTLVGGPTYVGTDYWANDNKLTDVYGLPEIKGELHLSGNPVNAIIKLVPEIKQKRFIRLLNDYQVIRGDTIVYDRLDEALYGVGEKLFRKYKLI